MSYKRDFEDEDDAHAEPEPKRAKTKTSKTRQHQNSAIDPTWGQKYVFSDLDDATTIPRGEEDDFEDDADAMAYLASVRQQASSIPHLLVAPKIQIGPQLPTSFFREEQESDEEGEVEEYASETDSRGFYEDGAYIGRAEDGDDVVGSPSLSGDSGALEEVYFAAVLKRYGRLRDALGAAPPADAESRLKGKHLDAPPFGRYSPTNKIWSALVRDTDPHPLQVALLSKDSALRILRVILGGRFLRQGYQVPERTSCWLWALLARLPDQGELNHTEMGWVRDLGRRAVLLGRSLAEMAALREELADEGLAMRDEDASSDVAEVLEDDEEEPHPIAVAEDDVAGDQGEEDEGEVEEADDRDVAMDIESDSEADEGQVSETQDDQDALREAKQALLARLAEAEDEQCREAAEQRARMNMRATLNMVLTVVGEFYGQRDLLEFRKPFVGI